MQAGASSARKLCALPRAYRPCCTHLRRPRLPRALHAPALLRGKTRQACTSAANAMAAASAAPVDDAGASPAPWHAQLQASVADFERAAAALLAVCEASEAAEALEVRPSHARGASQRARGAARADVPLLGRRAAARTNRC